MTSQPIRNVLALGLVAALLAGCGLRGDLVRPMPLWGDPALDGPTDPRVIKAAEDAAKAEEDRKDAERRAAREAERLRLEQLNPPAPAPTP